jgi:hypothetical protein
MVRTQPMARSGSAQLPMVAVTPVDLLEDG